MTDPPGTFRGCGPVTVFREVSSRRQAKWTFLSRSASSASRHYDDLVFNQPSADYGGVIFMGSRPRTSDGKRCDSMGGSLARSQEGLGQLAPGPPVQ